MNQKVSGKSKAANHLAHASSPHGAQFPQVHRLPHCSHLSHGKPQSPPGSTKSCPSHLCSRRRSPIGPPFRFNTRVLPNHPKNQRCKPSISAPPIVVAITTTSTASGSKNTKDSSITPLSTSQPKASTNAVTTEIISTTKNKTTPTEAGHSTTSLSNNTTPTATSNKVSTTIPITSTPALITTLTATGSSTLNVTNVSSPAVVGNSTAN